jgi:hypothetical protein
MPCFKNNVRNFLQALRSEPSSIANGGPLRAETETSDSGRFESLLRVRSGRHQETARATPLYPITAINL